MMRWTCRLALCAVMGASLPAQDVLTGESRLVLVNATVFDRQNRVRTDLSAEDFRLREDGKPVRIENLWLEDAPLSAVILVDASKSMDSRMDLSRAALRALAQSVKEEDEYCLAVFRDGYGEGCEFVSGSKDLQAEVASAVPRGDTGVIDSLLFAFERVKTAKNTRRMILLLSDGVDTASRGSWKDVRRQALESTATLYAVSPYVMREDDQWQSLTLQNLATETGGSALIARTPEDVAAKLLERMSVRSQYVLSFVPVHPYFDGRFHRLDVELSEDRGRSQRVYWKRGYYAPVK